jgi:hypothetical protein
MRTRYLCILAALSLVAPVYAEQWFAVASPNLQGVGPLVEIDLKTVRIRAQGGEGVIRVTFDTPQAHAAGFDFRSYVASAQFDCQRRVVSLTSSAYYSHSAGTGLRMGTDTSGREAGMPPGLIEGIPAAARQALLKATCTPTQN